MRYFKVILCGSASVGKTAIRFRFFGRGFSTSYMMTLGADFALKRMDKSVMQIWDLAGQPTFSVIRKDYYAGVHGIILVYDATRISTFQNLEIWLDEIVRHNGKMVPLIFVGNKVDLLKTGFEVVTEEMMANFQARMKELYGFDFPHYHSSALSGLNVDEIFDRLIEEIKIINE